VPAFAVSDFAKSCLGAPRADGLDKLHKHFCLFHPLAEHRL
jgi:hypothetical protein